jgi:hypothetical protein
MGSNHKLTFAFTLRPGQTERWAAMLATSIRERAGVMAGAPILALVAAAEQETIDGRVLRRLAALEVRVETFAASEEVLTFPFAAKVHAAAAAEELCAGRGDLLAWMDTDSLVLREPAPLLLPASKVVGYRPVDHTLIGPPWEEPLHEVWAQLYRDCSVEDAHLFPMRASVDERVLRPYFNAGLIVVRPKRVLLRDWRQTFGELHERGFYRGWYEREQLYAIFMHQMVLACVLLTSCAQEELVELSHLVSFPLHMHRDYPAARRPESLGEVITCRHDRHLDGEEWKSDPFIPKEMRDWIEGTP